MPAGEQEEQGAMETATVAAIADMGDLTPRQMVVAVQASILARRLDSEDDGSRAAALSRELRQVMAALVAMAGGRRQKDPVAARQDEVARKRAERAKRAAQ